ncbi:hypothetical protein BSKO_10016 [Bryopsis sp. KO-2023]|nr:hypothetical protein BSKO_10016 [Bryopsis sp. KO-2023]
MNTCSDAEKLKTSDGEETKIVQSKFNPYIDYYQILGVDRAASPAEIKKSYKKQALAFHPDKQTPSSVEQKEAIRQKFQEVLQAFDVLMDEEIRAIYDRVRDHMTAHGGRSLPLLSASEASLMSEGIGELSRLRRQGLKQKKHDSTEAEGSWDGMKMVFEGEGDEHVDTHPGDLVFTLKQKPHRSFKKMGKKNLEMRARAAVAGEIFYFDEVESIYGRRHLLMFDPVVESLKLKCCGGVWEKEIKGEGLFDPDDPFENEKGSLLVKVRFPPYSLRNRSITVACCRKAVQLIGRSDHALGGCLLGNVVANDIRQSLEAQEMFSDYRATLRSPLIVRVSPANQPTQTAASFGDVLDEKLPNAAFQTVLLPPNDVNLIAPLLDDEYAAIQEADILILDGRSETEKEGSDESWIEECSDRMEIAGLTEMIWKRWWCGAQIVGFGAGVALTGYFPVGSGKSRSTFPLIHHIVRPGSCSTGWTPLYEATAALEDRDKIGGYEREGLGIMPGSVLAVDPVTFEADEFVAPTRYEI